MSPRPLPGIVPETAAGRRLGLAVLVSTFGNGVFLTTSVLYLVRVAGLSAVAVGVGLTVAGIAGLLAGVPGGHLADVAGPRRTSVVLTAASGVCVLGWLAIGSVWVFVLVATLYTVCDRAAWAARQALTGSLFTGPELVRTRARMRSITNIGVAGGAGVGALVLVFDTRAAYAAALLLDGVTFGVCALVQRGLPERHTRATAPPAREWHHALRDRPYLALTAANMVLMLNAPLIEVVLPLWIAAHTDVPRPVVGLLVVLNTAGVILLQVRVSERIDSVRRAARASVTAGLLLAAACVAFGTTGRGAVGWAVALLVLGCVLHVLGEIVAAAASWVVSFDLAPPERLGQYQGLFGTGSTAAAQVAPAALILLVVEWGRPGWFVLAGVFVLGGLGFAALARRAPVPADAARASGG